jgi:uncharacterized protein YndB with AHSA1/START domain
MTNQTRGLEVTTPSDTEIVMTRAFAASRNLVFEAFTSCEHLKQWWGPSTWSLPVCEIDLRVGGKWRFLMKGEEGEMGMYGEYRVIERPGRLIQTENFEGEMFEAMGGGTLNTLLLEEVDADTTRMIATAVYKSKEARDGVLQFPMAEGAEDSFKRLDELLRTQV